MNRSYVQCNGCALIVILILTIFTLTFITNTVSAETGWKIYKLSSEGQTFKIPYKITNGDITKIQKEHEFPDMLISIETVPQKGGIIVITLPRNLLDAKVDQEDDKFIVLINGLEVEYEEIKNSICSRTLSIKLPSGAKEVEIIAAPPLSKVLSSSAITEVPPVYITTDKSNYELGEIIEVSGCTSLALDDEEIILEVINPEGKLFRTINITPEIDGSFSASLVVEGQNAINGTYTAKVTYAGKSATSSFVIPEFPVSMMIASIAMGSILAIMRVRK